MDGIESADKSCLHHISHEQRICRLEEDHEKTVSKIQKLEENMKNPSITLAIISLFGVMISAGAAFAGVVMAPIIMPMMKSWGWM